MKSRIAASFAVWLVAVAFVASIAWLAIDTAGQQVTSAQAAAPLPTDGQSGTTPPDTAAATAQPVVKQRPATSYQPTPSSTATTPAATPQSTASPISSTYASNVGRVRVVCTGSLISLNGGYAQPAPGWALRVVATSTTKIVIAFSAKGHPGVVLATDCVQGQPHFYPHRVPPRPPPNYPTPSATTPLPGT